MPAEARTRRARARGRTQRRLKPEERRAQMVEATLAALARHGAEGAGLRGVCRELRVSPSLVNYFFGGWNDLLLAAYRGLTARAAVEYERIGRPAEMRAPDRLRRLIERNVSPDWLADEVVGAYIALWDLSRTVPALKTEFTRFHRVRRRIVASLFAELAPRRTRRELDLLAAAFVVLLDGFWLELGLNPGNIPRRRAVEMCWAWIENNFPSQPVARRRR